MHRLYSYVKFRRWYCWCIQRSNSMILKVIWVKLGIEFFYFFSFRFNKWKCKQNSCIMRGAHYLKNTLAHKPSNSVHGNRCDTCTDSNKHKTSENCTQKATASSSFCLFLCSHEMVLGSQTTIRVFTYVAVTSQWGYKHNLHPQTQIPNLRLFFRLRIIRTQNSRVKPQCEHLPFKCAKQKLKNSDCN